MYKPISSRSSVHSLRQFVPKDYKKMSKTGFGAVSGAESEDTQICTFRKIFSTDAGQLSD